MRRSHNVKASRLTAALFGLLLATDEVTLGASAPPFPHIGEFQISQNGTPIVNVSSSSAALAVNAHGDLVATWTSIGSGTDDYDVFFRLYDSNLQPRTAAMRANTVVARPQVGSRIALGPQGSFVLVWQGYDFDQGDTGAYGQRFNANGNKVGTEFRVPVNVSHVQQVPAAVMAADGTFVVTWEGYGVVNNGTLDIFFRRFAADGAPLTGDVQVNVDTFNGQTTPDIAMDEQGNFVIVYFDYGMAGTTGGYLRRYAATGKPLAAPQPLDGTGSFDQEAANSPDAERTFRGDLEPGQRDLCTLL